MDWRKSFRHLLLIPFLFCSLIIGAQDSTGNEIEPEEEAEDWQEQTIEIENTGDSFGDESQPADSEKLKIEPIPPWTDEDWKKSKRGLEYTEKKKKEDQKQNEADREFKIEADEKSWFDGFFETRAAQVIVLSILIALLVYFIARFLGDRQAGRRDKKLKGSTFSLEDLEEHLEESDLDRFLRLAIEANDYRAAIRIFYLTIIKSLNEKQLIKWRKEKTNFDYVHEMRPTEHYDSFRHLTRAFEIVWYGNAPVSENEYHTLEPVFRGFLKRISNGSR